MLLMGLFALNYQYAMDANDVEEMKEMAVFMRVSDPRLFCTNIYSVNVK
jgi:hypothetical protein